MITLLLEVSHINQILPNLKLQGGTDAIFEVKDNLASGQPCVVVEVMVNLLFLPPLAPAPPPLEGSGRAADILAYAHRHATKNTVSGMWCLKQVRSKNRIKYFNMCSRATSKELNK